MGGFSDVGAHHNFEQPDFFTPELLLKEVWIQDLSLITYKAAEASIDSWYLAVPPKSKLKMIGYLID